MNPLSVVIDHHGVWHLVLFAVTALGAVAACRPLSQLFGWCPTLLWLYAAFTALYIIEFPGLPFGDYQRAFQATAGATLAELILIPLLAFLAFGRLRVVLPFIVWVECLAVWFFGRGMMEVASFDTALIALILPWMPIWLGLIALVTIAVKGGTTAMLIVLAENVALLMIGTRHKLRTASILAILAGASLFIFKEPLLAHGLDRIEHWTHYMDYWAGTPWRIVTGFGPGSFMWMSLLIDKFQPPMFLAMHNDFLQITFELGLAGLVLTVGTVWLALKRSWGKRRLFPLVVGSVVFGLFYHPLRFGASAVVLAMIYEAALLQESKTATKQFQL